MGNPVRHFQHLATRVRGPDAGLRSWRAWACFHLCWLELAAGEFPPDHEQAAREGLRYPSREEIEAGLAGAKCGLALLGRGNEEIRLPMLPVADATKGVIRKAMIHAGLLNA